jgi:hypothetical protein
MEKKIEKIKYEPMKASELDDHGVNVKFITYDELDNYNNINELFNESNYIVILIRWNDNTGHYIGLINDKNYIEKFDSFGKGHAYHKNLIGGKLNERLGQDENLLNKLLKESNKKIIKNRFEYQDYNNSELASCGRHTIYRMLNHKKKGMNLKNYNKLMKDLKNKTGYNYDEIVSYMVN